MSALIVSCYAFAKKSLVCTLVQVVRICECMRDADQAYTKQKHCIEKYLLLCNKSNNLLGN